MFKVPAPNFTQTPNALFDDWLPHLGMAELKVLMVILRKTFGWHKTRDRISLTQLEKFTGLGRGHIIKARKSLVEKGLIAKITTGETGKEETYYELVVAEDSNSSYQYPKEMGTGVTKNPTKETTTKEIKKDYVPHADASGIATLLLVAIKKIKPDFKEPNLKQWTKEISQMIKLDKRSPEKITKVLNWLPNDVFWSKNVLSPQRLRHHFDRLEMEMKDRVDDPNVTMDQRIKWKEHIEKEYRREIREGRVYVSEHFVEFSIRGNSPEKVYLKDPQFIFLCNNYLRKL